MSRSERQIEKARPRFGLIWRSLTSQLFLITIAPLTILLIAFTFGSLWLHQQAMRRMVGERDLAAVHTAAAAINEQILQRAADVSLVAELASTANSIEIESLLQSTTAIDRNFDFGLAVLASDGSLEALRGDPSVWNSLLGTALQQIAASSNQAPAELQPLIITLDHPKTNESLVFVFVRSPNGQRAAAGAFSPSVLADRVLAGSEANGHTASYLLVGPHKETLYQSGESFAVHKVGDHPGVAESLSGSSGTTYFDTVEDEHVVAYAPIGNLGWGLISEEPWELVDTPLLRTTQAAPLVLAPVLVLTILALWFSARQIVRPLQNLQAQSALLAEGNFGAIENAVGGISEVRRLQSTLIQMARQLQAAQQSLHDYIGAITTAQEDERRRLARELHDETIQSLIALKQQVQLAQLAFGSGTSQEALGDIAVMTEQTINELRRLIRALRPIYLEDLGLSTALEMLARETSQLAGIQVRFSIRGSERRLGSAPELSLYRMAQEGLSNVARHAEAQNASLQIRYDVDQVILEVEDDGRGFSAPKNRAELAPGGHFGLIGLYERAELIGAEIEIQSRLGQGTRLRVCYPTDS